ncbi:hypothetical protein HID58_055552 [Brassica napus]|uniref:Uncharacterized protein n=1 Tax=Brassica napus TaxID=3708 RepID=A0ABQ8ALM4_BRANA|nr:hypothetical protein HID58_055552 [Brassica napus]
MMDVSHPESFVGEALVKLAMEIQVVPAKTWRRHPGSHSASGTDFPASSSSSLSMAFSTGPRGNIAVGPRQRSVGGDCRQLCDEVLMLRGLVRDLTIQKELDVQ